VERTEILGAIRETAAANGGKPLGRNRFEQVTGITEYEIGRYWPRWGDAVREAGLEPNTLNRPFDEAELLEAYVELVATLGHVPTNVELRLERERNPTFPNAKVFQRFGSKAALIDRALVHCTERESHADALAILSEAGSASAVAPDVEGVAPQSVYGFVYLAEGHRGEYKIGRTNLVDRRLGELGAMAPIEYRLVHEIKTDDPAGVESYWHRRFADRRMRGEWFKLTAADVRAFKRWKRLY
jgi:hypothetical protein